MKHADWNVKDWMDLMHIALKKEGKKPLRDMRKLVWDNTLKILSKGQYQTPDKEVTLDLSPNIAEQTIYYDHEVKIPADAPRTERTLIKVEQEDTLNATRKMIDNGQNPCLLNMGNRHIPGGDIFDGWGAQEENLIRRSDYFRSIFTLLDDPIENLNALCEKLGITPFDLKRNPEHSYPMDVDFGGVYTPGVTVFRGDEANGYVLLDKPYKVDIVAVASLNKPSLILDQLDPDLIDTAKNKIRTIFRIAYLNGHRNMVLSAFGCGSFQNPPTQTALLFKNVLEEEEFHNRFEEIVFAILERYDLDFGKGNYSIFHNILDNNASE
jgi:hypothetical protein